MTDKEETETDRIRKAIEGFFWDDPVFSLPLVTRINTSKKEPCPFLDVLLGQVSNMTEKIDCGKSDKDRI